MPQNGKKEGVTLSLDSDLVCAIDYIAGRLDINRSEAGKLAFKMWLSQHFSDSPEFWNRVYFGVQNRSKQKGIF